MIRIFIYDIAVWLKVALSQSKLLSNAVLLGKVLAQVLMACRCTIVCLLVAVSSRLCCEELRFMSLLLKAKAREACKWL